MTLFLKDYLGDDFRISKTEKLLNGLYCSHSTSQPDTTFYNIHKFVHRTSLIGCLSPDGLLSCAESMQLSVEFGLEHQSNHTLIAFGGEDKKVCTGKTQAIMAMLIITTFLERSMK